MYSNALNYNSLFFIFLLLFPILLSCGNREVPQNPANNLQPRFSFGHEGEVILAAPWDMTTDGHNSIYIAESPTSKVYEFNFEGEFQRKVGREGRGPGEYLYPFSITTGEGRLYVQDTGNMRLVLFNLDDDSTGIFYIPHTFTEFEIYQDKIYGFAPENFRVLASSLDESLISVYNNKGNLINTFGGYLTPTEDIPAGMSWPHIAIADQVIYMVFQYFPIYRAYSLDGELLAEADLSQMLSAIEKPEQNYDESTYKRNHNGRQESTVAFRAMDLHGNRMFVSRHNMSIVIDEYLISEDHSLTYQTTYSYSNLPEQNIVQDFFYHARSNSFYILEYGEVPKVTVYQIDHNY